MWKLGSMRIALRWALGIRLGIGIGIAISSPEAPAQDLEPTCLAPPDTDEVRWIRGPETDRAHLDRWCGAVGPPLVRRAVRETLAPSAEDLVVVAWNVQVGAGAVATLVDDLRAGRLTGGEPVRHFALLLQEVHRHLDGALARPPPGAHTARRIAPEGRGPDILAVARDLGLHLFYVPSMRNGGEDQPPEDRGNAILSTLPLGDPWALELPLERQRRVAVAARVHLAGAEKALLLVSAHLENRSRWQGALRSFGRGRTRQARWLALALRGESAVVLGGDFNTWLRGTNAQALALLRENFPLPDTQSRRPTLVTRFSRDRRVDHLFFRLPAGWTAGYRVAEARYGSDHRPLLGSLRLGPAPGRPR